MLNKKPILIATGCAVAFVIGVYLVGRLYLDPSREDAPPTAKGHSHGDVSHDETPTVRPVSEKPAYIYDSEAKERPDGWDPELVFETGEKKIDLNYRPLTEEEQAEYERLKATENPEHYRNFEAGLRIVAIANIKEKHRPEVTKRIWADQEAGRISKEEALKQIREFYEFFAD